MSATGSGENLSYNFGESKRPSKRARKQEPDDIMRLLSTLEARVAKMETSLQEISRTQKLILEALQVGKTASGVNEPKKGLLDDF